MAKTKLGVVQVASARPAPRARVVWSEAAAARVHAEARKGALIGGGLSAVGNLLAYAGGEEADAPGAFISAAINSAAWSAGFASDQRDTENASAAGVAQSGLPARLLKGAAVGLGTAALAGGGLSAINQAGNSFVRRAAAPPRSSLSVAENAALAVLGLEQGVLPTQADLGKAYRLKSVKVHPDKPGGSDEAFRPVHDAYETLEPLTKFGRRAFV